MLSVSEYWGLKQNKERAGLNTGGLNKTKKEEESLTNQTYLYLPYCFV